MDSSTLPPRSFQVTLVTSYLLFKHLHHNLSGHLPDSWTLAMILTIYDQGLNSRTSKTRKLIIVQKLEPDLWTSKTKPGRRCNVNRKRSTNEMTHSQTLPFAISVVSPGIEVVSCGPTELLKIEVPEVKVIWRTRNSPQGPQPLLLESYRLTY